MEKLRILVGSQDESFLSVQLTGLKRSFEVQEAHNDPMVYFLMNGWQPHICILDGSTMSSVLKPLRQKNNKLGLVVFLSRANVEKEDQAFKDGADLVSELPKTFASFQVKIESIVRRLRPHLASSLVLPGGDAKIGLLPAPKEVLHFGDLEIYSKEFIVKKNGLILPLAPTQFRLLEAFVFYQDKLLSREWLKERIWNKTSISSRSIDAQISKLKKVVPEFDQHLTNIYGKGYILSKDQRKAA